MTPDLLEAVRALAADTQSGASELLPRAIDVLRSAAAGGPGPLAEAARSVCRAQPGMAPFWNAAAAALAGSSRPGALDRFEQRFRRAGNAVRRVAAEALARDAGTRGPAEPRLHLTTVSFSGTVLGIACELARRGPLAVACAEGRPGLEGRRLAEQLAAAGVAVEILTDAAIGLALDRTSALLVGADAVAPRWFVNKCGTRQLASAATEAGVAVFVAATRDKFLPDALAGLLALVDHDPAEVWPSAPAGVTVRNPYFERVPIGLVTGLITDAGLLGADAAEEICRANGAGLTPETVAALSQ